MVVYAGDSVVTTTAAAATAAATATAVDACDATDASNVVPAPPTQLLAQCRTLQEVEGAVEGGGRGKRRQRKWTAFRLPVTGVLL